MHCVCVAGLAFWPSAAQPIVWTVNQLFSMKMQIFAFAHIALKSMVTLFEFALCHSLLIEVFHTAKYAECLDRWGIIFTPINLHHRFTLTMAHHPSSARNWIWHIYTISNSKTLICGWRVPVRSMVYMRHNFRNPLNWFCVAAVLCSRVLRNLNMVCVDEIYRIVHASICAHPDLWSSCANLCIVTIWVVCELEYNVKQWKNNKILKFQDGATYNKSWNVYA